MAVLPIILLNGTTADANEVMSDFFPLYNDIAPVNVGVANKTGAGPFVLGTGATITNPTISGATFTGAVPQLVPIGSIIPFYDFNAALTFDATYWAYCNGQSKTVGTIGAQTLPDLSGRYLVGFGTDGGGNNGSAAWAVPPVGNASNQISLIHSHTVNAHTHDLGNHTHTGAAHTHSPGTLEFLFGQWDTGTNQLLVGDGVTTSLKADLTAGTANGWLFSDPGFNVDYHTISGAGATASTAPGSGSVPSTNTSGSASPGTDSQLSATQSIQPISIRVRYLMRIL